MSQFSGMSTGTTLGKGMEDLYQNENYLQDADKIREFIEEHTGFKVVKISSNPKSAQITLRAKS